MWSCRIGRCGARQGQREPRDNCVGVWLALGGAACTTLPGHMAQPTGLRVAPPDPGRRQAKAKYPGYIRAENGPHRPERPWRAQTHGWKATVTMPTEILKLELINTIWREPVVICYNNVEGKRYILEFLQG